MKRDESGFTLVEMLVAMAVFATISVGFFSVMFQVSKGSDKARNVAQVSEEARLGFNRMLRDTREGLDLTAASATSFTVQVDFEGDGLGPQNLTFSKSGNTIRLNGELLIAGVDCLRTNPTGPCQQDVFRFSSNRLEYDWNGDGITTWQELDDSSHPSHGVVGIGNDDDILNIELASLTDVTFALSVASGDSTSRLIAQAQLRNRR